MQAKRDEIADKSDAAAGIANGFLDCHTCQHGGPSSLALTDFERATYNCGWLPKSKRRPTRVRPFPEAPVCPGYLIGQPEVYEAARALGWKRDGSLRDHYDEPLTPAVRDCIDILDSACKEVEREYMRKQKREMTRGRS